MQDPETIKQRLAAVDLPIVSRWDVRVGVDHTGDPAAYVTAVLVEGVRAREVYQQVEAAANLRIGDLRTPEEWVYYDYCEADEDVA